MKVNKKNKYLIVGLFLGVLIVSAIYVLINHRNQIGFTLHIRFPKLIAFILVAVCTSFTTITFQTITQNNLLTPSIIGIDSLYIFFQTLLVFSLGQQAALLSNPFFNFLTSTILTIFASITLFTFFFKKYPGEMLMLLMFGLVFSTLTESLNTFLQVIMDPNEFSLVLSRTLTSFNNVDTNLLGITALVTIPCVLYLYTKSNDLDVIHLGDEYATSLGIPVQQEYLSFYIIIAFVTSISTSLVGPTSFLGFLGANLTYRIFSTYKHQYLFIGSTLITLIFILSGQIIVEHVFNTQTTLSVVINFIGGIYFILLLLIERRD